MVKVEVNQKFHGPTILELEPTLVDSTENPVRIGWRGSKAEVRLIESHHDRDFLVFVSNLHEMSLVSSLLGAPIQMDGTVVVKGRDALASKKAYNWKEFSGEIGSVVARSLVVKLASDAIRQGMHPRLATVASDILQGGASPLDADVLLRMGK